MRRWMFGLSALVGTTALVMACSVGDDCDPGLCAGPLVGSDGGDGADVQGDVVDVPPGCKPELDPKDAPACVVDSYGVFVDAAKGADGNPGTKAAPFKTLTAALAKAGSLPRVYVCEGTYAEHVKLTRGVSIYGGFACADWAYSGAKAKIAPTDVGFALHVAAVTSPVVVADVEMIAQPGTKAAPSSIGAFVARSTDVTMRRVKITAGTGFTGANGEPAKPAEPGTSVSGSMNGNPGTAALGALENVCTCSTGGTTTGGRGGDLAGTVNGATGAPAHMPPAGGTGAGQSRATCESAGPAAQPGSDGPGGAGALPPALGTVDETGWATGSGQAGKSGEPGQGGGGGGSYTIGAAALHGGGGGGGCGGCGGGGGGGGAGGGSSLAILAFESSMKLEASALAAADAGGGGAGAPGETGGIGGAKGNSVGNACQGGGGGTGGSGGSGAGGSGGISAGILHKGPAPTVDPATDAAITFGKPGDKGTGGTPQTNDGKPGDAKKVLAL